MRETDLDLQKLNFFTEGNTFTGSKTKDPEAGAVLRYRVVPDRENEILTAHCWKQDLCFEKALEPEEGTFPLTEEGMAGLRAWLTDHYAGV